MLRSTRRADSKIALNRKKVAQPALDAAHDIELGMLDPSARAVRRDDRLIAAWKVIPVVIAIRPLHVIAVNGLGVGRVRVDAESPITHDVWLQPSHSSMPLLLLGSVTWSGSIARACTRPLPTCHSQENTRRRPGCAGTVRDPSRPTNRFRREIHRSRCWP